MAARHGQGVAKRAIRDEFQGPKASYDRCAVGPRRRLARANQPFQILAYQVPKAVQAHHLLRRNRRARLNPAHAKSPWTFSRPVADHSLPLDERCAEAGSHPQPWLHHKLVRVLSRAAPDEQRVVAPLGPGESSGCLLRHPRAQFANATVGSHFAGELDEVHAKGAPGAHTSGKERALETQQAHVEDGERPGRREVSSYTACDGEPRGVDLALLRRRHDLRAAVASAQWRY